MRIRLNIEKSKERDRVVNDYNDFDSKLDKIWNVLFKIGVVALLIGFPVLLWFGIYTGKLRSSINVVFPGIFFALGLVALYSCLFGDKFIRFQGAPDPNQNREILLRLLKEYFPANSLYEGGNVMTSYGKPKGFMKSRKSRNRILVIFDGGDILMNVSVFTSTGIQSPFHTIFHHWTIWRIRNRLINETKE